MCERGIAGIRHFAFGDRAVGAASYTSGKLNLARHGCYQAHFPNIAARIARKAGKARQDAVKITRSTRGLHYTWTALRSVINHPSRAVNKYRYGCAFR